MSDPQQTDPNDSAQRPDAPGDESDAPMSVWEEFVDFVRNNKKWWITPIVIAIVLMILLIFMSDKPLVAPIYTIF